jgi:hypothetical protein
MTSPVSLTSPWALIGTGNDDQLTIPIAERPEISSVDMGFAPSVLIDDP